MGREPGILPDVAKNRIFQATVAREHPTEGWILMNRKGGGWASYGHPHESLRAILDSWEVRLGAAGVDECGVFVEVVPL